MVILEFFDNYFFRYEKPCGGRPVLFQRRHARSPEQRYTRLQISTPTRPYGELLPVSALSPVAVVARRGVSFGI